MNAAITREPSAALAACEVTFIDREPIDIDRARSQHAEYQAALRWAGLEVIPLAPLEAHADACFVEDTAIVLDELAIMTNPGAASRRGESASIAEALRALRVVCEIEAPATIEGGDVLRLGRTLYIGRSSRTNDDGMRAVAELVRSHGYRVVPVQVAGCLHLKTACTALTDGTLIANPDWVDLAPFAGYRIERVNPTEPWAANVLTVNGRAVLDRRHRHAADLASRLGLDVRPIDTSEFAKAEAGVTCLNLLLNRRAGTAPAPKLKH